MEVLFGFQVIQSILLALGILIAPIAVLVILQKNKRQDLVWTVSGCLFLVLSIILFGVGFNANDHYADPPWTYRPPTGDGSGAILGAVACLIVAAVLLVAGCMAVKVGLCKPRTGAAAPFEFRLKKLQFKKAKPDRGASDFVNPSPEPVAQDGAVCARCGAKLAPGTRFCGRCGNAVGSEQ